MKKEKRSKLILNTLQKQIPKLKLDPKPRGKI